MEARQQPEAGKQQKRTVILFGVVMLSVALLVPAVRAFSYAQPRDMFHTETFTVSPKPDGDVRTRFLSETFFLKKGVYTVQYDATVPTETEIVVGTAERLRTEDGADAAGGIQCIPLRILGGSAHREWRIHAERGTEAALLVREYYEGNGVPPAQISCSVVYRPMLSMCCYAVDTLLAFAVVFVAVWVLWRALSLRQAQRPDTWIPVLLYALVVFISLPVFKDYITYGHDTIFHVRRIASLAEELFSGRIPVRLSQTWKNGYGYPVSIFYGDLWMIPAAVLFRLGVPLFRCYQLLVVLLNATAVLLSYHCFRKISGKPWGALVLSAMYAGSVRYAANLYLRGALGEAAGMAVLPLAVLGFWKLLQERHGVSAGVYLVIGFTALIQVHTLTTIQAAVFAALLCLLHIRELLREKRWMTLAFAAGTTALLNAWFLVPFVDYYRKHSFYAKMLLSVAETAVKPSQLVFPEESFKAAGFGTILLLLLCVAVVLFRVVPWSVMRVAVLAVLAVCMGTTLFPWSFLETHLPALYGLVGGRMQYVWRYFSIATLLVCVTAALVSRHMTFDAQRKKYADPAVFLLLACVSLSGSFRVQFESIHPKEEKPVLRAADVWNGDGGDALYMFDDLVWHEVPPETILADEGIAYSNVTREGTTFTAEVENAAEEEGRIAFPVWNYYGYAAKGMADGSPVTELPVTDGEGHRVSVVIPAGFSGNVTVGFREPWHWRIADVMPLIVIAGFVFYQIRNKRPLTPPDKPANV